MRDGRVPYYPALAQACDDTDTGLFLCTCAALTAEAGGLPFTRHMAPRTPSWQDLIPWERRKMARTICKVFSPVPGEKEPCELLKSIHPHVFRENVRYHFGHAAVLKALLEVLQPRETLLCAIAPGPVWWTGPVDEWKAQTISMLYSTGTVPVQVPQEDLATAIECVLEECLQDAPHMSPPTGGWPTWLTGYVWKRYTPSEAVDFTFLDFDLAWARIRRVTGLMVVRPSPSRQRDLAIKLKAQIRELLKKLGTFPLDAYLRAYKSRCVHGRMPVSLSGVLAASSLDMA